MAGLHPFPKRQTPGANGERPEDDLWLECDEELRRLSEEANALLAKIRDGQVPS